MKRKSSFKGLMSAMAAVALLSFSGGVIAADNPFKVKHKSKFYYHLNGADVVPPAPSKAKVKLHLKADYGLGYSCGKFDPVASLKNGLNKLKGGLEDLENAIIVGGTAALSSLPMYLLQRARPGLASELRNKKAEWMEKFNISLKSCEQHENEILAGDNPYGDWVKMAKMAGYEEQTKKGNDVIEAKKNVESGEDACPKWVGGVKAGCEGSEPIKVTADVVSAGYMQMVGLEASLSAKASANSASKGTQLEKSLGTVEETIEFAQQVLGENSITTQGSNAGPKTTPGVGLLAKVDEERESVTEALTNILDDLSDDEEDWVAIASPTAGITEGLIEAYRQLPPQDKVLAKSALVEDIAFARVVDKALMLRRLLLSGIKEPNVYNSPANKEVLGQIEELSQYIDELMFERRIRQELLSGTARTIIQHSESLNRETNTNYPRIMPSSGTMIPGGGKLSNDEG